MRNQVWTEAGPWKWTSEAGELSLAADASKEDRKAAGHKLREQWRRKHMRAFLSSDRRDATEIRNAVGNGWYSEDALQRARKMHDCNGDVLAVLTGAAVSPAMLAVAMARQTRQDVIEADAACPWCDLQWGTWDHCCWECEHNCIAGPPPAHVVQRRL